MKFNSRKIAAKSRVFLRQFPFVCFILLVSLFFSSCGERKFESNDSLLRKAIESAVDRGEWQEAKAWAFKAVNQNGKDANARVVFALTLEQSDELDRALEEVKQAVLLDPDNFMAQYTKGRLLFKSESYEDCPAPLEHAKKLKPDCPQVLSLLARSYAYLGVDDKAIKNYAALAKLGEYRKSPEVYNELGVLFFAKKDYKRAARFFKKALSFDANAPVVNLNMGVLCDTLTLACENVDRKRKYARISEKHYIRYLKFTTGNLSIEKSRRTVVARIKKIRSLTSQ